MSEKSRKCNESCPGYLTPRGGWCGYSGSWGKSVKEGAVCHLGYSQESCLREPTREEAGRQPRMLVFTRNLHMIH